MTAAADPHAPPQRSTPGPDQPAHRQHTGTGIVSLVFGILQFVGLPVIGAIVALVTGYLSRDEAKRDPTVSDELGRVGRILGWIGLILPVALILLVLTVVMVVAVVGVGLGVVTAV